MMERFYKSNKEDTELNQPKWKLDYFVYKRYCKEET